MLGREDMLIDTFVCVNFFDFEKKYFTNSAGVYKLRIKRSDRSNGCVVSRKTEPTNQQTCMSAHREVTLQKKDTIMTKKVFFF